MPYSSRLPGGGMRFEMASRFGHTPTADNPRIQERLAHYRKPEDCFDPKRIEDLVEPADALVQAAQPGIRYVVAVDGSGHEYEETFDRYPSTRVLYLQIAGVFIDLDHMSKHEGPFVSPSKIAEATEAAVVAGFLPGSFLEHEKYTDPRTAFRAELFDLFSATRIQQQFSLLELLLEVQKHGISQDQQAAARGEILLPKCPNDACSLNEVNVARTRGLSVPAQSMMPCPECGIELWPTDTFRVFEAFRPDASNGEVMGRCRDIIEHLVLVGVALSLERLYPKLLSQTAFLYDGDLAVFGEAARIFRGLLGVWQAIMGRCIKRGQEPPVMLGIAKTGYPVEHFHGIQRFISPGSFMRLDDSYMHEVLRVNSLTETYYGRKFFYHASDGQLIVLTVPPIQGPAYVKSSNGAPDVHSQPARFPTLKRTFDALDAMGTRLYDDAVIPVSLAHTWAAYPLNNADHVLRILTEDTLKKKA
jgi:hypothetical protein